MDHIRREDCPVKNMPGRSTNPAFGPSGIAAVATDDTFTAYATFAPKYGTMKPHYHENETMYVVGAMDAFVRYGDTPETMTHRDSLKAGEMIRARNGEWHIFEFDSEDGFLDIVAFFAVPMCHTTETDKN